MSVVDSGEITDSEWTRHQQIIAGFETAWKRGDRPKIGAFLPVDEPRGHELLVELVHADLEFRIKAGESARVEEYLRKYPGLGQVRETVLGLILAECSIRRRKEPGLKLDRYRQRFPEFRAELETPPAEASTLNGPTEPEKKPILEARPAVELPLPRRLGKFELRRKLGSGSFGVVYLGWDTVIRREVAIKIPRPEVVAAKSDLRAFLREARHAAELQHANIVPILEAGPIAGTDCIVRAYIEGTTLADRLREGQFSSEEAASLLAVVADAIDHAHQKGIIHRDLKPSNILLDLQGLPHVSDFGLAKREAGDTTLSPVGSPGLMIGTPAYMSPEQARGETYRVDARSDVYSLGVVLYEVLTGALPFRGRGRMLQIQIEEAEPFAPRSLNDEIPLDLETICLKALAKEPTERYPTARAMADDLLRFLKGEPVGAKAELVPRKPKRPSRISPRAYATCAGGLLAMLALGATTALWLQADARRARDAEGLERTYQAMLNLAGSAPTRGGEARSGRSELVWDLAAGLVSTLDGDPALVEAVADARLRLAERAALEGSDREAGPSWLRAVQATEASLEKRPGNFQRLADLAGALARLSEVRARAGQSAESRSFLDRSIKTWSEALVLLNGPGDGSSPDENHQLRLAETLLRLAEAKKLVGESAEVHRVESIAGNLSRRSSPLIPPFQWRLTRLWLDLARWQLSENQPRQAETFALRSLQLCRESIPKDENSEAGIGRACLALARVTRELGRGSEGLARADESIQRFERLLGDDPSRLEERRDLARALFESGLLLEHSARRTEAIARFRRSLQVLLALDRDHPRSHVTTSELAKVRAALARTDRAEGRWLLALGSQAMAIFDQARAVVLAPGEAGYRRALGPLSKGLLSIPTRSRAARAAE